MRRLVLHAEALTPLVIAGAADEGGGPGYEGLRPPSLRGVMRFWFRAMMGGVVNASPGYDKLRGLEARVFGSTELSSAVWITTRPLWTEDSCTASLCMNDRRVEGQDGATRDYSVVKKAAHGPGSKFAVQLEARTLQPLQIAAQSLWLTAMIGGIGNGARRGFGSFSLSWANSDPRTQDHDIVPPLACPDTDLREMAGFFASSFHQIRKTYEQVAGSVRGTPIPSCPTLAKHTARMWVVAPHPEGKPWTSWDQAMDALREQLYRAYKAERGLRSIGSSTPRVASPLIIQIKKTVAGKYFGVLIAFENANYLGQGSAWLADFLTNRVGSLANQEVTLP